MTIFTEGQTPSLHEVLASRESRVKYQTELLEIFPQGTLISYKCNIPGAVKNNTIIQDLFGVGRAEVEAVLKSTYNDILYFKELNLKTGPESFYIVDDSPERIKNCMMKIEEDKGIGRLFDIDVLYKTDKEIKSVSRIQMNRSMRKCLICSKDAKSCSRNRTHSLEEVHAKMEDIIVKDGRVII